MPSSVPYSTPSAPPPSDLAGVDAVSLLQELERWEASTLTPGGWNRRFLPGYFGRFAPADFHAVFDRDFHNLHTRRATKLAYIAPRGGAKSTWATLAYPLRCAVEGWEPYTLILSDSAGQANELLRHIRAELEGNELLAAVYPDSTGEGPEWNQNRIRLRNGCVIEALGTGSKIRGRRNRSERPSLVIFDDVQSNEDILSAARREQAWIWATREVLNAGDERTTFISVGSALHTEAVSVGLGQLAGWTGRTFKAIHQWPDRREMWSEFERIATNIADENRITVATEFVAANHDAMHQGAKVYWPERFDLTSLMLKRCEIGAPSFEAEMQGVAGAGIPTEFPAEWFEGEDLWFDQWPEDLILKVIALDPSKGSDGQGKDYQAIVLIGVSIQDGRFVLYVDANMDKTGVTAMCDRLVVLCRSFASAGRRLVDSVVCEDNGTMGFMPTALEAAATRTQYMLPWVCRASTGSKQSRILNQLHEPLRRRQIRFRRSPGCRILVGQIRGWPFEAFDDGPDALAIGMTRVAEILNADGGR